MSRDKEVWCGTSDCRACAIRETVLFKGLEENELNLIEDAIENISLAPEAVLYHMGAPGDAVYTVREGLLKLVQYLPDGSYRVVRIACGGDVAGLESMLAQLYQHDAIALQPSLICRIPIEVLNRLGRTNPKVFQELMRRWQRALSEADAWLTELSTGTSRQRVIRLLMRLADHRGESAVPLFGRRDMGAMLGITTESASRVIAELKRVNMLEENPLGFRCDRAALEQALSG